jgi:hypothetical protein
MILALTLLAVYANAQTDCKLPANAVAGYTFTESDLIANCNSDGCPTLTGVTCTAGYDGTPATTGCTVGDEFVVLTGCDATQCTVATPYPAGYTMTAPAVGANAAENVAGCMSSNSDSDCKTALTGLACDTTGGYSGTADAAACTTSDANVVLSGCEVVPTQCTYPAAAQTGYTFTPSDPITDCSVGACTTPTITATCDTGANYEGTVGIVAVCTDDAPAVVLNGCLIPTQCVVPSTVPAGYTGMVADANVVGCTDVDCSSPTMTDFACADGYEGTVAVAACSASDTSAVFSGCTEVQTTTEAPTDVTTTENTDDSALTVSVALAASIAMAMF